jgi:hypothetical protein
VLVAPRFEVEFDLGGVDRDVLGGAVVLDCVDVGPGVRQQVDQVLEGAGAVLQDGPDPEEPAALDQPPADDVREDVEVDVAAAERGDDCLAVLVGEALLQYRRQRHRAGALDERLRALQQRGHRVSYLGVGDGDHLVDPPFDDLEGQLADLPGGDAVGDGVDGIALDDRPLPEGLGDAGGALGLNADHAGVGPPLDRGRDARDEAAAADGDDHGVDLGALLDDFQAQGALSGHHRRVVEGVDVGQSLLAFDLVGALGGGVVVDAVEDDVAAVGVGRLYLRDGGVLRHDDGGVDARPRGRERHPLGVVAGAGGHDAGRPALVAQPGYLVGRAAELERARPLEVLQFQVDVGTRPRRVGGRVLQRGLPGGLGDPVPGGENVGEFEHGRTTRGAMVCLPGGAAARQRRNGRGRSVCIPS